MPKDEARAAEAAVQAGREHYSAKRYKPALGHFTRAMRLCPCNRGMKRERCSCKDYELVASKDGSIFTEAMYKCKCSVGKTFNKCDRDLHIQALDYRAATFEALKEFERARRDAEWVLELAPRRLDGYLRLGKVARLQKKHDFAWKVYAAGIEVGNASEDTDPRKLQQLCAARLPLQKRFSRKDPLELPLVLVLMVFEYLDLPTLIQCLRVSKTWRRGLTGTATVSLWRELDFGSRSYRRAPSLGCLKKLLAYSGNDARRITIGDANRFQLNQAKLSVLLNGAANLDTLEIRVRDQERLKETFYAQANHKLKRLRSLILEGQSNDSVNLVGGGAPLLLEGLLNNAARNLSHLQLDINDMAEGFHTHAPVMPCLRSLRLARSSDRLDIFLLAARFPALEQLWLQDVVLTSAAAESLIGKSFLPHLQALVIRYEERRLTLWNVQPIRLVFWSLERIGALRFIDLTVPGPLEDDDGGFDTLGAAALQSVPPVMDREQRSIRYEGLESLRLTDMALNPARVQKLLTPVLGNEKLHTLDICFPLDDLGQVGGQKSLEHMAKYEWLRGAPSIHTIGLYDFRFREYPRNDDDLPLPKFLASFPQLETLEIASTTYNEGELCTVIKAILDVTHLRTVYQSQVRGVLLDELRVLAASRGVKLIWGQRPMEWPIEFKD